jgi:hypothetical protein
LANAIKAVDYFTDLKQDKLNIVATNNSWEAEVSLKLFRTLLKEPTMQEILFIAAAGNSGTDNDATRATTSYP